MDHRTLIAATIWSPMRHDVLKSLPRPRLKPQARSYSICSLTPASVTFQQVRYGCRSRTPRLCQTVRSRIAVQDHKICNSRSLTLLPFERAITSTVSMRKRHDAEAAERKLANRPVGLPFCHVAREHLKRSPIVGLAV